MIMSKIPPETRNRKGKDAFLFAKNFLNNPLRNASIMPSSSFACKAMLKGVDFSKIDSVVELGPGTGVFSGEIVKRCRPGTKIILIELEKSYVKSLREKFDNRVSVENQSAHFLDEILKKHGIEKPDLLISGLPFFEEAISPHLLKTIKSLTENGTIFRFFTYMPPAVKRVYKNLPIKMLDFVLRNIPPLWIFGIN